jgi:hypothetical protein
LKGGLGFGALAGLAKNLIPMATQGLKTVLAHPATQQFAQAALQQGKDFAIQAAHEHINQLGLNPQSTNLLKQAASMHINGN